MFGMARHQALVDLHRVERPGPKLAQIGDAGAEVVDRQARAQLSQAREMRRETGVGGSGTFRYFENQSSRRDGVGFHGGRQQLLETGIAQLSLGKIDAREQRRREREIALPMRKIM